MASARFAAAARLPVSPRVPGTARFRLSVLFGAILIAVLAVPAAAVAQDSTPTPPAATPPPDDAAPAAAGALCALSGHLAGSGEERAELTGELRDIPVQQPTGRPLAEQEVWQLPDGQQPVLVLDTTAPVTDVEVLVTLAGQSFLVDSRQLAEPEHRHVANLTLPHLGSVVGTMGLTVSGGGCEQPVVLAVDQPLWSSLVGALALAVTVLAGLLTVLVARLRTGGWLRRFLSAAPLGLVAGTGQAAVLLESGMVSPFATFPWWAPVAGVVLAGLLPFTRWWRWRRRQRHHHQPPAAGPEWLPPAHAPLGSWQPVAGFARTDVAEVHRAVDAAGRRALVKVAAASWYGDPAARVLLEREQRTLSGLEHPNVVRLRETVPGDGPPTLVFEDVAGGPLNQLPPGTLSGPQAMTVISGLLAGLAAVHAQGLVHRAVRPEHIWLGSGGVVLANLELACPGTEHPVAPDGADMPYASPEQRAGRVLDPRADQYAAAAVLRELLAGAGGEAPEPVAALLRAALAEDPADRPDPAEFPERLRQAAAEGYGPDWAGRGALAGALATHGALGSATAGYAAGGAGASGPGASGAAGSGLGAAGSGGAGLGSAGTAGGSAAGTAGGATAGASAGKGMALVNAAVAVAAGAAIGGAAVLVAPEPAPAADVVITPEQARVIMVRTVAEGVAAEYDHVALAGGSRVSISDMRSIHESVRDAELTGVEVGVPPGQTSYPAWFIGSAELPYDEGVHSLSVRFERESAEDPWLLTRFVWSTDQSLGVPALDDDGWLAPVPETVEPAYSAEEVAALYHEWALERHTRRYEQEEGDLAAHGPLVRIPHSHSYLVEGFDFEVSFEGLAAPAEVVIPQVDGTVQTARGQRLVYEGEEDLTEAYERGEMPPPEMADVTLTPLAGDLVLVTFEVTGEVTVTGFDVDGEQAPCGEAPSFRYQGDEYRIFATDYRVLVQAWVPLVPAAGGPPAATGPSPTPDGDGEDGADGDGADGDGEESDGEESDGEDEAGDDVTVLLTDPILQTDRGSDRSERC